MSDFNNRETIKSYFVTNALPTEEQFAEFIDAFVHKHHETNESIGLGTADPKNILDVKGNVVIGGQYAGKEVAPDDGLMVEGNVVIGTDQPSGAELQVNGNVRFDNGGLTMGGEEVINSSGEWVGDKAGLQGEQGDPGPEGPEGPPGPAGTSSWNDGTDKVTTHDQVGIGTSDPTTQLEVDGYVTKQELGFTLTKVKDIDKNGRIIFEKPLTNISRGWDEDNSEFKAPEAGGYFFCSTVNFTDPPGGARLVLTVNDKETITIWDDRSRLPMGTSSLVIPLQKGDTVASQMEWSGEKFDIDLIYSINFSGYRL